jgi:hypothetical protein
MKRLGSAIALAIVMGLSSPAPAITITGNTANSTGNLGNFTANFVYNAVSNASATLTVDLTNTSPAANGGFITAFVFNNPGNQITNVTAGSPFTAPFGVDGGPNFNNNSINGAPFGQFDIGSSTGGSFEGGGNPNGGIAVGNTGHFVFNLTGTNLLSLNEQSFVNTLSVGPGDGQGDQFFVVRFRGFNNGGSDKVPGQPGGGGGVPEPASIVLWSLSFVGLAGYGMLRRRLAGS